MNWLNSRQKEQIKAIAVIFGGVLFVLGSAIVTVLIYAAIVAIPVAAILLVLRLFGVI